MIAAAISDFLIDLQMADFYSVDNWCHQALDLWDAPEAFLHVFNYNLKSNFNANMVALLAVLRMVVKGGIKVNDRIKK